jgi:hypothetical protein
MASEEDVSLSCDTATTAVRTTEAMCEGAGCRSRKAGENPRRKTAGAQLCPGCGSDLAADLAAIPGLYEECGRVLDGIRGPREKTTGGGLPGLPFNTAAAEARSAIVGILVSWCALVAEERIVTAPRRNVRALAAFLARHVHWLAAHAAASDVSREVAKVARQARWAARGDYVRHVRVGRCVESGCAGDLVTAVRPAGANGTADIVCRSDPSHRWAGHEWLRLSRRLSAASPPAQWLTPAEVSRLWDIPLGSVYRLASERRWRRQSRSGRAYYHAADVEKALRGRGD